MDDLDPKLVLRWAKELERSAVILINWTIQH